MQEPASWNRHDQQQREPQHQFSGGGSLAWGRHHPDSNPWFDEYNTPRNNYPQSEQFNHFQSVNHYSNIQGPRNVNQGNQDQYEDPRPPHFGDNQYGRPDLHSGRGDRVSGPSTDNFSGVNQELLNTADRVIVQQYEHWGELNEEGKAMLRLVSRNLNTPVHSAN